jgi:four helix bundle protein
MRRAAVSAASNIVEGSSRRSQSDYVRFLEISLGSAKELAYQLELSARLELIERSLVTNACEACTELIRLLASLVRAFDMQRSVRDLPCSL